jgi:ABC-type lipoprotein export system ATPase subunit
VRDGRERRTVIDSLSLGIARRELVVLRGPSGSGKTTLLALIGAMLSPTSGEVFLDGEPTSRLREVHRAEVRRHKVGFVFQDHQLVMGMSARENILLPCVPDGVQLRDEQMADALLERFSLHGVAHSKAEALSGGERQRAAIARALIRAPRLLLCDEPTGNLDRAAADNVASVLLDLHRREATMLVIVTHSVQLAARCPIRFELTDRNLKRVV